MGKTLTTQKASNARVMDMHQKKLSCRSAKIAVRYVSAFEGCSHYSRLKRTEAEVTSGSEARSISTSLSLSVGAGLKLLGTAVSTSLLRTEAKARVYVSNRALDCHHKWIRLIHPKEHVCHPQMIGGGSVLFIVTKRNAYMTTLLRTPYSEASDQI